MNERSIDRRPPVQTAIVLHPIRPRSGEARSPEQRLAEAVGLAEALDLKVHDALVVPIRAVVPATLFGKGKTEEIGALCAGADADIVVVDDNLTPVQQRNLEKAWNVKVIDRTGLILEIFGRRARTREGRLQVELARLGYERSRLVRTWTHLERQRGGFGFLGGPGETQIEADRPAAGRTNRQAKARAGGCPPHPRPAPPGPPAYAVPDPRPGRLHQRRQVDPVQPPDPGHGRSQGHAVRDAGSHRPPGEAAQRPTGDAVGHRGLHLRPAARTGGGLSRPPWKRCRRLTSSCTCATSPATRASRRPPMWNWCWSNSAPGTSPAGR